MKYLKIDKNGCFICQGDSHLDLIASKKEVFDHFLHPDLISVSVTIEGPAMISYSSVAELPTATDIFHYIRDKGPDSIDFVLFVEKGQKVVFWKPEWRSNQYVHTEKEREKDLFLKLRGPEVIEDDKLADQYLAFYDGPLFTEGDPKKMKNGINVYRLGYV